MPAPAEKAPSGSILVHDPRYDRASVDGRTVVYARVSSHDQKTSLAGQVARTFEGANRVGMAVDEVVTEIGSGLNGRRRKLSRVVSDPTVTTIVVEHRDRLARFGVDHLEAALGATGRQVVVVADAETDDHLMRGMVEVLTSMCARLYGRRGARNRAEKAMRCAANDVGSSGVAPGGKDADHG